MLRTRSFSLHRDRFHEGSDTPRAFLERCIEVIDSQEPAVQAFVVINIEAARVAADAATRRYAEGAPLSPVDGMVVVVKDIIDTVDMPTQMNSPIFEGHWPKIDAACVRALRTGGALILGKTHTTEFAFGRSAPTVNPHDGTSTPGGSSSGSAAAVGAGMASVGFATQTQGSTLRPASYCGAVGYKPSHGLLSLEGVHPVSQTLDHLGVIAADVRDAWRVARQVSNLHPASGSAGLPGTEDAMPRSAMPRRVGLLRFPAFDELDAEAGTEFERAVRMIEAAGVDVRSSEDAPDLRALVAGFESVPEASLDLIAWELRWPYIGYDAAFPGELGPRISEMLERSRGLLRQDYLRQIDLRLHLRSKVAALRGEYDAFVMPASSGPAVEGLAFTGSRAFQTPWTFIGLPAWSVPGLSSGGLPFGIQLAGHLCDDLRLAGFVEWLEAALQRTAH